VKTKQKRHRINRPVVYISQMVFKAILVSKDGEKNVKLAF